MIACLEWPFPGMASKKMQHGKIKQSRKAEPVNFSANLDLSLLGSASAPPTARASSLRVKASAPKVRGAVAVVDASQVSPFHAHALPSWRFVDGFISASSSHRPRSALLFHVKSAYERVQVCKVKS